MKQPPLNQLHHVIVPLKRFLMDFLLPSVHLYASRKYQARWLNQIDFSLIAKYDMYGADLLQNTKPRLQYAPAPWARRLHHPLSHDQQQKS